MTSSNGYCANVETSNYRKTFGDDKLSYYVITDQNKRCFHDDSLLSQGRATARGPSYKLVVKELILSCTPPPPAVLYKPSQALHVFLLGSMKYHELVTYPAQN